ncbi:MAG: NADH-quinone oxidoreductase subunit NuoE [archaeon]|nr:NADH-quinone oxidoreductase subunit NuoE [archaeon]
MTDLELEEIENLLSKIESDKKNVVVLLQHIQEHYNYLPTHVLYYVSNKLKIPLAKFYAVATFYTQFSFNPKGKFIITVCDGTACHVKGSPLLSHFLVNELKINDGETTKDMLFSLETVACLGCCAISPVCFINEDVYGKLTPKKLKDIIKKIRKKEQSEMK